MIATIGGIPVYNALITDGDTGMFKISLVDDPAVMSNFQTFDTAKRPMLYAIESEEKRLVRGCIMRADFPIYRRDEINGEYYIIYKPEQIRKMAEKYLAESRQNDVNIMHQADSDVTGVQMVQYFIKGNGVSVDGFDDCADGSLFGEFHVTNEDVWNEIKTGLYKGFSLEGVFEMTPENDIERTEQIVDVLDGAFNRLTKHFSNITMSKLSKFKAALAKALQVFANITTDKGVMSWDGDDDLKIGDSVFIVDEEGNTTPANDGEYKTDDNKIIIVESGVVTDIKDVEIEPVAEPEIETPVDVENEGEETPESTETPDDKDAIIDELKNRIAELENENAALKEEVGKLQNMSAAKPAHDEIETSMQFAKTGVKGIDNLARILNAK